MNLLGHTTFDLYEIIPDFYREQMVSALSSIESTFLGFFRLCAGDRRRARRQAKAIQNFADCIGIDRTKDSHTPFTEQRARGVSLLNQVYLQARVSFLRSFVDAKIS